MPRRNDYVPSLAELLVRFGANVQSGQIVALSSEPGKEPLARAVAEAACLAQVAGFAVGNGAVPAETVVIHQLPLAAR